MSNRANAWLSKRPILNSLPGLLAAYSQNKAANITTAFWDELLVKVKGEIDDLPRQLNPLTCDAEYLPLLSFITGFTGSYSILAYTDAQKRILISRAYDLIWRYKGSEEVLDFILDTLDVPHLVWYSTYFLAGISTTDHYIGTSNLFAYVLISIGVPRNSVKWSNILLNVKLYTSAYSNISVCYDAFYAGISATEEPVFDTPTISIKAGDYPPLHS